MDNQSNELKKEIQELRKENLDINQTIISPMKWIIHLKIINSMN